MSITDNQNLCSLQVLLTFLCNLMSIQGDGIILQGIFYDYHHDHDFDYDYHSVRKRQVDGVQSRFRLDDKGKGNIKIHSVSFINGLELSNHEIQCANHFLDFMKHDDSYLENIMLDRNYFSESYFSEKNTLEEFLTRVKRDALYDPTIETNHVNDFNHRHYQNGFHYFGKIPRSYELPEYIHRCYYGDRNIVCVVISDENDKYALSNHKINYIAQSKLRWLIT